MTPLIDTPLNSDIFETFFRISPNLTCIASKDARFEFINPLWETVLGWSIDELKSHEFLHFIHPDDLQLTLNEMKKLAAGQTTFEFENRYRTKSGSYKSILWTSVFHEERYFALARDITRLRQLEGTVEQAHASSKLALMGEMTCGIAHELSTPLSVIWEGLQILKEGGESDQLKNTLAMMERSTNQMCHIVRGMRTVSAKSDSKQFKNIDLQEIIFQSRDFLKSKLINHSIDFKNLVTEKILIRAVPGDILQILINLISNSDQAISTSGEGSRWIEISSETKDEIIIVNVVDSGFGVAPEIADKIIEPFFTTKTESFGIGLGLSISKRLAEQNSGKLYLVKTSRNTHFALELPAATTNH